MPFVVSAGPRRHGRAVFMARNYHSTPSYRLSSSGLGMASWHFCQARRSYPPESPIAVITNFFATQPYAVVHQHHARKKLQAHVTAHPCITADIIAGSARHGWVAMQVE